jgi:predicted Zn-dependent protease
MLFTFGRLEEALADARHILELSPDRHETRWVAAQIYRDLGRFEEAKQECDRLLEANARNLQEVQALEAQILIGAGELESAAKLLDSLLAQRPGYEPALMYRGMVYFNQGQFAEAVKALEKIRWATIPKLRQIGLYYLALSLGRLGKDAESKEAFAALANDQRAVRFQSDALQEPNDWVLQVRAARALIAARYDDLAIQILDRGLSRNGGNYDALVLLAECHEKKGRKTLAEQYRQKARGLQK